MIPFLLNSCHLEKLRKVKKKKNTREETNQLSITVTEIITVTVQAGFERQMGPLPRRQVRQGAQCRQERHTTWGNTTSAHNNTPNSCSSATYFSTKESLPSTNYTSPPGLLLNPKVWLDVKRIICTKCLLSSIFNKKWLPVAHKLSWK